MTRVDSVWFNDSSGDTDGFTYFYLGLTEKSRYVKKVVQLQKKYFKPKVGSLLIFPNWLKHAVMPFFGEGERRTLVSQMQTLFLRII